MLSRPRHDREVLINNPQRIIVVIQKPLSKYTRRLRRFERLALKYQRRSTALAGINVSVHPLRLQLELHTRCATERKAAGESAAEYTEQQRAGNGTDKQNSRPRFDSG